MKYEQELIGRVESLLSDIESMYAGEEFTGGEVEHFYGPFSMGRENLEGDMEVSWPNLAISAERVREILDRR